MTEHLPAAECALSVVIGTTDTGRQDVVLLVQCSCGHQSVMPLRPDQARSTAAALLEGAQTVDGGGGLN